MKKEEEVEGGKRIGQKEKARRMKRGRDKMRWSRVKNSSKTARKTAKHEAQQGKGEKEGRGYVSATPPRSPRCSIHPARNDVRGARERLLVGHAEVSPGACTRHTQTPISASAPSYALLEAAPSGEGALRRPPTAKDVVRSRNTRGGHRERRWPLGRTPGEEILYYTPVLISSSASEADVPSKYCSQPQDARWESAAGCG
ncbi:hypothetical protein B0H21DRAFT_737850 [Amylocystis lapponica]|nr:hypothetical protein B0H21DRAFT_737850 [Amylocystis lapponica]